MTLERRHTIRDKVCLAAFVSVEGGAGNTILNLSESGMGLQATPSATLSENSSPSEVRLSIDLPATQSSIEARGVVTWSDAKGRAGVRFVNPPEVITAGVNRGGYACYFLDPDEITLELVQPPPSP